MECFPSDNSVQGLTLTLVASLGSSALAQPADAAYDLAGEGSKADPEGAYTVHYWQGRGGGGPLVASGLLIAICCWSWPSRSSQENCS
ncbi:hypothetical protein BJX64DRAFT_77619 [Aspergillus heterothallicus]